MATPIFIKMHVLKRPLFFILCALSMCTLAAPVVPFTTSNNSPLVHLYGLPPLQDVTLLNANHSRWSIREDYSSHFARSEANNEKSIIDGESIRTTIAYSSKGNGNFHWQLAVPYIGFSGGTLDGFVDGWHEFFSLPKGGRNAVASDQLQYFYQRDGDILLDITDSQSGVGDTLLSLQWAIKNQLNFAQQQSVFTNVKLPTGESSKMLGSGAIDIAVGLAGANTDKWWDKESNWFFSGGVLWLGNGDVLAKLQNNYVLFGGLGGGINLTPQIRLKTQLDMNTEFYKDTSLSQIGREAAQLTMGGEIITDDGWRIDLGVSEDLRVNASPDVTFHFALYFTL